MTTVAALILATPVFGFALVPPTSGISPQVQAASDAVHMAEPSPDMNEGASDMEQYAEAMRRRESLVRIHRPLGVATWASMALTLVLGTIQYYNLYGFFAARGETPCVTGGAIFGQGQCSGTPWIHLGGAALTSALYGTTFAVSMMLPSVDDDGDDDGAYARTLRMHRTLRWVHFAGMIAQSLLGFFIANAQRFGIDRANDYGTLQALATVHMGLGVATFGALTWAGALMVL